MVIDNFRKIWYFDLSLDFLVDHLLMTNAITTETTMEETRVRVLFYTLKSFLITRNLLFTLSFLLVGGTLTSKMQRCVLTAFITSPMPDELLIRAFAAIVAPPLTLEDIQTLTILLYDKRNHETARNIKKGVLTPYLVSTFISP